MPFIVIIVLALLPVISLGAETGAQRLDRFSHATTSFQARFEQVIIDENKKVLEKASGTLSMQRPGKFRWVYEKPYQQLIVSDGDKLWLYDKDLEQVTVKSLNSGIGDTPAMLLTRERSLAEDFKIVELGVKKQLQWVELTPKSNTLDFEHINLAFDTESIKSMELLDKLGQVIKIHFSDVSLNPELSQQLFLFTPPPDADVIGNDG